MEEVFDVEGDGGSVHGRVVVDGGVVGDVGAHGERHRFGLRNAGVTPGGSAPPRQSAQAEQYRRQGDQPRRV